MMNPPYEQGRPNPPRTVVIDPHPHDFICRACKKPGVSESPNTKYHQTPKCKAVQAQNAMARALRARARKRSGK